MQKISIIAIFLSVSFVSCDILEQLLIPPVDSSQTQTEPSRQEAPAPRSRTPKSVEETADGANAKDVGTESDKMQSTGSTTGDIYQQAGLSASQGQKVDAINKNHRLEIREAMKAANGDRDVIGASTKRLNAKRDQAIQGVMSAAQFKKYQELLLGGQGQMRSTKPKGF